MNTACLLTGGNMGDREQNLATARQLIESGCGKIGKASSIYKTAAWGKTDQPAFLNQALIIDTPLSPNQLMQCILDVEEKMGRVRQEKFGPRIIDIDILLFNDDIVSTFLVNIPHPEMQNRRFVLMPLAEIAPSLVHPLLKKTIKELLSECPDQLTVEKYA
jgi:2-amino-4-hydroxy-6-hydroxymethyldihydropteridine diphosphokinase